MADLLRVSILGTLPGGEDWSVNPVWDITTGAVITFAEVNACVAAVNGVTVPTALRAAMSAGTSVTGARVEARTASGTLEQLAEGLRTTAVTGSSSTPHPGQIAWVVSLRTNTAGGSGRGRIYWPGNGVVVSPSSLRPSTADTLSFVTAWQGYLSALETAIDAVIDETIDLAVWSRKNAALYPVTRLLAGDILDTQRRRRDSLPEAYSEVSYP